MEKPIQAARLAEKYGSSIYLPFFSVQYDVFVSFPVENMLPAREIILKISKYVWGYKFKWNTNQCAIVVA